jgi:hypothetical protein
MPVIANATYMGAGAGNFPQGDGAELLIFRDNAGGKYYGSIFTDYNGGNGGVGITVEDLASGEDSRARLEAGELVLSNNIWFGFAAGNDLALFAPQDFVQTHLTANNNQLVDPQLTSVSREHNGMLDPRPASAGPAATGATQPADAFFAAVDYYGAFDPGAPLWTNGWTGLFQERISTQDMVTSVERGVENNSTIPASFELSQNFPNPFNPSTTINYNLPSLGKVQIAVYNMMGQRVAIILDEVRPAGNNNITWEAALDLSTGVYLYQLRFDGKPIGIRKMTLIK